MEIGTNGDGLKQAIEHAFEEMDNDKVEGFKYPIGEIRGNPIYITWEDESVATKELIEFDPDGLVFTAVYEK